MQKTLKTLLQGLEPLEVRGDLEIPIKGLTHDSRKVEEGFLFVAVPGTRQDGHRFIRGAIEQGARAALTENILENGIPASLVRVADSRKALAEVSANFYDRPSEKLLLVGVTGTNGKTTTTLLLESILKHEGYSVGVIGTLAYRWAHKHRAAPMTTPESLDLQALFHEMHKDKVTHVIMEVSSHALALRRVEGCAFRAGVFTNLSQDHLDFHSSMEDYFQAKGLLFRSHLGGKGQGAIAVINRDDPFGERLISEAGGEAWSYSAAGADARVWVKAAGLSPSGIEATFSTPSGDIRVNSPLLGRLNLYNILCAVTTALGLGISQRAISQGVSALSLVDGRLQRVTVSSERAYQVIVDYAHTPDAMEKSLGCLKEMTRGRLWVVFGCGGDRDRGKRPLMGKVAARLGDLVILTSDNPRSENPEKILEEIEVGVRDAGLVPLFGNPPDFSHKGYTIESDRRKAIELALAWGLPGDTIFIGGKGHETYQLIGGEVFPFDDREVVQNFFQREGAGCAGTGLSRPPGFQDTGKTP